MSYSIYKKGTGPIYSAYGESVVAHGLTWKEAHDKVAALSTTTCNFYFWMQPDRK